MSDSLQPHELQHTNLPCPSLSSGVYSNSWVSDAIQTSHPLMPPSLALSLSQHQSLFQRLALCIRWSKYWSLSFNIGLSNENSVLISFSINWFNLLADSVSAESLATISTWISLIKKLLWPWSLLCPMKAAGSARINASPHPLNSPQTITGWSWCIKNPAIWFFLCSNSKMCVLCWIPAFSQQDKAPITHNNNWLDNASYINCLFWAHFLLPLLGISYLTPSKYFAIIFFVWGSASWETQTRTTCYLWLWGLLIIGGCSQREQP